MALDSQTNKIVCVKVENNKKSQKLINEGRIMNILAEDKDHLGIPDLCWVGTDNLIS